MTIAGLQSNQKGLPFSSIRIQKFGLIHEVCLGHRSGWLLGLGVGIGQKTLSQADIYSAPRASEASGHWLFQGHWILKDGRNFVRWSWQYSIDGRGWGLRDFWPQSIIWKVARYRLFGACGNSVVVWVQRDEQADQI